MENLLLRLLENNVLTELGAVPFELDLALHLLLIPGRPIHLAGRFVLDDYKVWL